MSRSSSQCALVLALTAFLIAAFYFYRPRQPNPLPGSIPVEFVLESDQPSEYRAVEDPTLPLDYSRTYRLVPSNGVVKVPRGSFANSPPALFAVTRILDREGKVLSSRNVPRPGEFGFLGIQGRGGHGEPPPGDKGVNYYFRFGIAK